MYVGKYVCACECMSMNMTVHVYECMCAFVHLCVCMCVCVCVYMPWDEYGDQKKTFTHGFQGSNSGCKAWWQVPLPDSPQSNLSLRMWILL